MIAQIKRKASTPAPRSGHRNQERGAELVNWIHIFLFFPHLWMLRKIIQRFTRIFFCRSVSRQDVENRWSIFKSNSVLGVSNEVGFLAQSPTRLHKQKSHNRRWHSWISVSIIKWEAAAPGWQRPLAFHTVLHIKRHLHLLCRSLLPAIGPPVSLYQCSSPMINLIKHRPWRVRHARYSQQTQIKFKHM